MRTATLEEFAIRWANSFPGLPDTSAPFSSREKAQSALEASPIDGHIVRRAVTYTEWEKEQR